MDREQTLVIMGVLRAAYPNYYRGLSRLEADEVVGLWTEMFADDPAELVAAAVKALIVTDERGFPPHIGAVKAQMGRLAAPRALLPAEAWGRVWQAVRRSGYNSRAEFDKLPDGLKALVGGPEQLRDWARMDAETVQSVVASNFQRSYRARAEGERALQAMPPRLRRLAEGLGERLTLPGGREGGPACSES